MKYDSKMSMNECNKNKNKNMNMNMNNNNNNNNNNNSESIISSLLPHTISILILESFSKSSKIHSTP
jgi:hypothetical protein